MRVDDDAVGDRQPGAFGEPGSGRHTDADHDEVDGLGAAVAEHDAFDRAGAGERRDAGSEPQRDAVVGVEGGEDPADRVAEDPLERDGRGVDEHDLGTHLTGGSGNLGTDPAGTDHGHPGAGPESVTQPEGVATGAEVVDSVEVGAGDRQPSRGGARGDDDRAALDPLSAVEDERAEWRGRAR